VVLVGNIDRVQLDDFVAKTETYIDRKIRSLVLTGREFDALKGKKGFKPILKLWEAGYKEMRTDQKNRMTSIMQG
jgi:Icc-related predicted phosphoesterase